MPFPLKFIRINFQQLKPFWKRHYLSGASPYLVRHVVNII